MEVKKMGNNYVVIDNDKMLSSYIYVGKFDEDGYAIVINHKNETQFIDKQGNLYDADKNPIKKEYYMGE